MIWYCSVVPSNTILRIVVGCVGPDGEVVRQDAVRLGARWVTDEDAIRRFVHRLTPKMDARHVQGPLSSRRRAVEHADRELDRRGL
jgi:hypothetical protein